MSEYEKAANAFLKRHAITFKAEHVGVKLPPWNDGPHTMTEDQHWRVTFKRTIGKSRRTLGFDFWQSINATSKGQPVTAYDALACISSDFHCPETFKDFCSDYDFDIDSRKAEQTFKRASAFAKRLRGFFSEEEAADLSEL